MATPTEEWPKPFLLQIHAQAVEQGFIWVEPITEADAASLKSRLYRIRRRSDTSMAAFIPPEYHLVMIGNWQQVDGENGRLPVIFNKKADGQALPQIRTATGDEVEAFVPQPKPTTPPPELTLDPADLTMKPDEVSDFVQQMRDRAAKRRKEGE